MPLDPSVQRAMSSLAESLTKDITPQETLEELTKGAATAIPGFEATSISLRAEPESNDLNTVTATADWVLRCDELQVQLQQGPCIEVLRVGVPIASPDVRTDPRWPIYGRAVDELGVRSQACVPVPHQGPNMVLNLYSTKQFELDADAMEVAILFASSAAITLRHMHEIEGLRSAMDTRSLIGSAIGVVMERHKLRRDLAFAFLVRLSQHTNTKLRDLAAQLVEDLEKEDGRK